MVAIVTVPGCEDVINNWGGGPVPGGDPGTQTEEDLTSSIGVFPRLCANAVPAGQKGEGTHREVYGPDLEGAPLI